MVCTRAAWRKDARKNPRCDGSANRVCIGASVSKPARARLDQIRQTKSRHRSCICAAANSGHQPYSSRAFAEAQCAHFAHDHGHQRFSGAARRPASRYRHAACSARGRAEPEAVANHRAGPDVGPQRQTSTHPAISNRREFTEIFYATTRST